MSEMTMIEILRQTIDDEMARDERVFILGADVGKSGGVFQVTQGLLEKYGSDRVIDSPLSESSIVGVGIGAALYGRRPICEIQFADFVHLSFNQIVNEAARMCYRSNGQWTVPIVIRIPYGGGISGGLYYSQSVEAFFTHVPGLKVVAPSTPYDAGGLLRSAVRDPNPVIFLEPKKGYRMLKGEVPTGEYMVPIGPAGISREGKDVSIFVYGMMHYYALQAAKLLAGEGIDVEVVNLRTLYPVDRETILSSVEKTKRALIVHEDNLTGGYGAEIAATIAEGAFNSLDAPVKRLCGPDVPGVPYSAPMQEWFMPDTDKIVDEVRSLVKY
jgi:2-oxoisovalerate dehydrogenase E1 component beta subunit